jgi:hypothetical protein
MRIDRIRISGFKSVADPRLDDLEPFSVFAGPNGSEVVKISNLRNFILVTPAKAGV